MALDTLPLLEKGGEVVLVIDIFPHVEKGSGRHSHRHLPFFLEKERSGDGQRHPPSSRKGYGVAMFLHNLSLRSSPCSSGKGKGWS